MSDRIALASPGVPIVVGAVLFVVPLPPTSMIGIGPIVLGVLLWAEESLGGRREGRVGEEEAEPTDWPPTVEPSRPADGAHSRQPERCAKQ